MALMLAAASAAEAAKINEYLFDDGTANDAFGLYDLGAAGSTAPVFQHGYVTLDGSDSRLENLVGYGSSGFGAFTLSMWVRSDTVNQGTFKGIFANNTSSTAGYSWQIDSNNGVYRIISQQGVSAASSIAPTAGAWDHLVAVKQSNSLAELYVNGQLAASDTANLGNLDDIRVGTNRNADNFYAADYDSVQLWNSAEDAGRLYAAGRYAPAHRWHAGVYDISADAAWGQTVGGYDITFDGALDLVPTGLGTVQNAYSAPTGQITGIGGDALFGSGGEGSFELLFKPADLAGNHVLFETGGSGNGMAFALLDNELRFVAQNGTDGRITASYALDGAATSAYQHVVGVIENPNDGTGTVRLYLNGSLVDTQSAASGFGAWAGSDLTGIGRVQGTVAGGLTGLSSYDGELALINHYGHTLTTDLVGDIYLDVIPEPGTLFAFGGLLFLVLRRRAGRRNP